MSNQIVKNERQAQIQRAFLKECSQSRLDAIVGADNAKQFMSDFITLAEQNPNAGLDNLARCCIEIASLKLPIAKQAGQAYVVPRDGLYQVEISYKGWMVLARRVGIAVRAYPIFEGDDFSYRIEGFEQRFTYTPAQSNNSDRQLLFVAVATKDVVTGLESIELVDAQKLEQLRNKGGKRGEANNSPAYREWLIEMYRAKAIKYVLRKMPIDTMDSSIFRAFSTDDKNDVGYESIQKSQQAQTQSQQGQQKRSLLGEAFAPQQAQTQEANNQDFEFDPQTGEYVQNQKAQGQGQREEKEQNLPELNLDDL